MFNVSMAIVFVHTSSLL